MNTLETMTAVENRLVQLNPHVSVDCVIFGFDEGDLKVLLIERNLDERDHQSRLYSLPGIGLAS